MSKEEEREKRLIDQMNQELEEQEGAENASLKTITEILNEEKPRTIFVPGLGCKIKYYPLRFGDLPELTKEGGFDQFDLIMEMLLRTWGKAEKTVTKESLKKLGLPACLEISKLLGIGSIKVIPLGSSKPQPSQGSVKV